MRAARTDANQTEIVEALEGVGAFVQSLASVGRGVPDLLVGYHGRWYLMEVKDGKKPPSRRRRTDDQIRWRDRVAARAQIDLVKSVDEALTAIGLCF